MTETQQALPAPPAPVDDGDRRHALRVNSGAPVTRARTWTGWVVAAFAEAKTDGALSTHGKVPRKCSPPRRRATRRPRSLKP